MKLSKKDISDLIYNELNYIYCNNCRYTNEIYNADACENCNRKSMDWEVSRKCCDNLAEQIINQ